MSNRTFALGAGLLFVLSGAAPAQSRPGLAFDQVIHTLAGGDSSTSVVHLAATGADIRMEFEKGSAVGPFARLPMGDHAIIILRNGGTEMITLNPDKKQYFSVKPIEMMDGARKMMASMGGSMTFDTSASSMHQDSLGPGPVIDGHPTLLYRTTVRLKMNSSMMGHQNTIDTQAISDFAMASDLGDFADVLTANPFSGMSESMGLTKGFFEKAVPVEHRMHGFPLHVVQQSIQTSNGVTRTTTTTIATKNVRRVPVPDSAFAIPADYKFISLPFASSGGIN
jgi:hypothetical protein